MNELSPVQFLQPCKQTVEHESDLSAVHPPGSLQTVGEGIRQIFPLPSIEIVGGIHRAADPIFGDLDVADLEQIRMIALPVVSKSGQFPFGIAAVIGDDFQRDARSDRIFRQPHLAVGAAAAFLQQCAVAKPITVPVYHRSTTPVSTPDPVRSCAAESPVIWRNSAFSPDRPDWENSSDRR